MTKVVGILGGGQLARMLALSGAPLGLRFLVLDNISDACAGQFVPMVVGDYRDENVLAEFASKVDVATFDFENVPSESAQWLAERIPVFPSPRALAIAQDRLAEKNLFRELGISVAPFADISSREDLQNAIEKIGLPCILKTRRLGYDGKGQFRIKEAGLGAGDSGLGKATPDAAWEALGAQASTVGLILEGFVAFQREISVIVVRGRDGEFRAWPLTENWHENGVLSASLAPATDCDDLQKTALAYAKRVAESLDYVGVFALELFLKDGELFANEMAPRVHNSGHWTIEGAETSQFENHLRAVLGLPLGSTAAIGTSCMLNWIGKMPSSLPVLSNAHGHWHDYGKMPREGRKVGHATLRADSHSELFEALKQVGADLNRKAQVEAPISRLKL
jgi:5-(carboxyamino)imidazole ribonucleotide synthase